MQLYTQQQLDRRRAYSNAWNKAHRDRCNAIHRAHRARKKAGLARTYAKHIVLPQETATTTAKGQELNPSSAAPPRVTPASEDSAWTAYVWYPQWAMARAACTDPHHPSYPRIGARSVRFNLTEAQCDELWNSAAADYMSLPVLQRIDERGHYSLENCRFAEQDKPLA